MSLMRLFTLVAAVLFSGAQAASAASAPFSAVLDASQEVSAVVSPSAGTASGLLTGDFGSNNFVFQYGIAYSGLTTPIAPVAGTGGHLHNAPAGANGGIVHILDTTPFNYTGTQAGFITGDWRWDDATNPLTETLAQALLDGEIYINLHTDNFPSGEIRGQLGAVPLPGAEVLMASAVVALTALGWLRSKARAS